MASIKKYNISTTGQEVHTADIKLIGTKTMEKSTYPCLYTSRPSQVHPTRVLAEHAPHTWNPPVRGAKMQYTEET
jgi:hypothetical protein